MEEKAQSKFNQKWIIILLLLLVILMGAVLGVVLLRSGDEVSDDGVIGYATEAKVMLDQDALQAAVDEAQKNAKEGRVALQYQNDAYSDDGINFTCYIANSPSNLYDMFLAIYADTELTDQLYLSGLVPPGSGFETLKLDHALPSGDNTVYVALTQVDTDESGQQVIKNQVVYTIIFHVA